MLKRLLIVGSLAMQSGWTQPPPPPNTQPKPVNDPTNLNNLPSDPGIPGGNPGFATNPGAGLSDQMREAADQIFATNLALQALTAVELGKMASNSASHADVKAYAAKMTETNSRFSERLKRVATRGHITIPAGLDDKHQARVNKLAKVSGREFDAAFVRDQVTSGERNLRSFEQEIQNGSDTGLRTLATRASPMMQKQLQEARDLEKALKAK